MANYRRDLTKERFWRRAIRRRQVGDLTIRDFCEREGLRESAYHFWMRELRRRDAETVPSFRTDSTAAPLAIDNERHRARYVPVTVNALPIIHAVAEIVSTSGWTVRVSRECHAETLGMVLDVLETRAC
jgi:hypothetical protein